MADWDVAPALWRAALTSRLAQDLREHPLLVTEPIWNPTKNREKTIEVAFEDFQVPAFYLAKNAVCAGFASGKSSGLVIDFGAANIAVTPIHDGFVLKKGSARVPLGGDFLSNQIRAYLASQNIPLSAHYQVLAKVPVEVGKPTEATLRTNWPEGKPPTDSFNQFEEERVLTEFKECTAQMWANQGPIPSNNPDGSPPNGLGVRTFEFPDGYNLVFGSERFRIAEGIFNPHAMFTAPDIPHPDPETTLGVGYLVVTAMRDVDMEIKSHILNNVVVTGAGSLLYGFHDRVNLELSNAFPGPRVRLTAPGNSVERKYANWLGGSILASLGSFHQLWISKKEYDEHGAPPPSHPSGFTDNDLTRFVAQARTLWRSGVSKMEKFGERRNGGSVSCGLLLKDEYEESFTCTVTQRLKLFEREIPRRCQLKASHSSSISLVTRRDSPEVVLAPEFDAHIYHRRLSTWYS